jgi:hypothetical protein
MSIALCEWLVSGDATELPFFVWLEGHPICTTTPGLDPEYRGVYRDRVRMTQYRADETATNVKIATVECGKLWAEAMDDETKKELLSTRDGGGKGFACGYAFVWTTTRSIYTAKHGLSSPDGRMQPTHHSTFTRGRKVKCAGMWQVFDGKISLLDNNTGHYRTDIPHLLEFVKFLDQNGVFAENAKIEDVLGLAARGGARSVAEWLDTAERIMARGAVAETRRIVAPNRERTGQEEKGEKSLAADFKSRLIAGKNVPTVKKDS